MCYLIAKDINKQGCFALKAKLGKHLAQFSSELDKSLPHERIWGQTPIENATNVTKCVTNFS